MSIDKIIKKWEDKHTELLSFYSNSRMNDEASRINRSRMKEILEFIEDLKKIKSPPKIEHVSCIDCGGTEERSKAHWGAGGWNKNGSKEDGYVCDPCWNGRGASMIRF